MYEYEFVRLEARQFRWAGRTVDDAEWQDLVKRYAADGWRLVQIFAPSISSYGRAKFYDVIFERNSSR